MSGTQTQAQIELTPQEAEAVLELWARKQAEGELRSRLNVQDLAEATGLPQAEIEKLVESVRASKKTPPIQAPVKKVKPVNSLLIAVSVLVWLTILAGVAMFAFEEGFSKGRRTPYAIAPPALGEMGMAVPTALAEIPVPTDGAIYVGPNSSSITSAIPTGSNVDFQGYKVKGTNISSASEDTIHGALQSIVSNLEPEGGLAMGPEHATSTILNALDNNDGKLVDGQIQFPKMTVSTGAASMNLTIPVARVGNPSIVETVRQERLKRLRILANWIVNNRANPR